MSIFRGTGRRCDWCGKFSMHHAGEYTRPDGVSAGYIRQWKFNDDDDGKDICDECAANRCPLCASDQIVRLTPITPGPIGWGGRCKECGERWVMPAPVDLYPVEDEAPSRPEKGATT